MYLTDEKKTKRKRPEPVNTGGHSLVNLTEPLHPHLEDEALLAGEPVGAAGNGMKLQFGADKYAKILKQQIDYIGGKRDRANF